ncbi:hypothetical protein ACGF3C_16245 [Micromonospora sp. NPDC047762]|uniref:hypothetical protein n=1 Tax=Micromonospora sp. NPDC047762 TaxID=3364255 RepID=UPI0037152302
MRDESQAANSGVVVGGLNFHTMKAPERAGLHVPWSWLSLGLLVLAITSLGTLSVVVGIKNVDILSTIALALAVLAFASQLIVSLAQAQGSAQQLTQTERVNSETRSALAEVKSTANALLTNQSEQFNQVLSALLRSATEDAVREATEASTVVDVHDTGGPAGAIDPEAVAERVEERVKKLLSHQSATGVGGETRMRVPGTLAAQAGRQILDIFRTLSPGALLLFINIATTGAPDFSRTIVFLSLAGDQNPALQELFDRRLLRGQPLPQGRHNVQLTGAGKVLALLLFGDHFRENWYWDEISRMAAPPSATT